MQQVLSDHDRGEVLTVGLAQINNSFSGQNYLPYAIGLLQAYAERHAGAPGQFRFLLPVYKRIPVASAVSQLREADAVGFSLYVWNERLTLEVARRLKAERPDILYGREVGSNYQGQGLKLSKHFRAG